MTGIPCRYVIACIRDTRRHVESYVHECYHADAYKLAYESMINLVPDSSQWEKVHCIPILPPLKKKLLGRRKKKRKRGADELGRTHN